MLRDEKFDFFKGMLMLGVVYGHVLTALQGGSGITFAIHRFVRTYDMPMFALISGFFLKKSCSRHTLIENLLNKMGGILLPSLIWEFIFNIVGGSFTLSTNRLWFTYALFFVSLIIIIVDRINSKWIKGLVFFLSIIIFHTIIHDPYNIGFLLAPAIVGYYMADDDVKWNDRGIVQKRTVKIGIIIMFLIMQSFWKNDYNVWNVKCNIFANEYHIYNAFVIAFRFSIGIIGALVMSEVFDFLYQALINRDNESKSLSNWICSVGTQTLELYILQSWLISIAGVKFVNIISGIMGYNPFTVNSSLLLVVFGPIVTIVTIFFMQLIARLLAKIPVIGKYCFNIPLNKMFIKLKMKSM